MSWRLSPKAMSMSPFSSWTRRVPTLSMIGISMRDTSAGSVPAKSGLATRTIAWPGSADSTLNRPPPTGVVLIHSCAHSSSAGAFSWASLESNTYMQIAWICGDSGLANSWVNRTVVRSTTSTCSGVP